MPEPERYNQKWFEEYCSRLFLNKEDDWLFYKRTAVFACKNLDKEALTLEVGCGLGGLSYRLSSYCKNVIGIDSSQYACAKAKSFYHLNQLKFMVADAEHLPFKSGIFDAVVVSHLFEHLDDSQARNVQREIYRILKLGATLTVEQPVYGKESIADIIFLYLLGSRKDKELYYCTNKAIKEAKIKYPGEDFYHLEGIGNPTHKRIYDIRLLVGELRNAGFTDFHFYKRKFFRILFYNSDTLFKQYVWFYLKAPAIIKRTLLVSPGSLIKAIKL